MTEKTANPSKHKSRNDLRRFVVLCVPRTGSYHLSSLLNSAPDVVCHGELFKNDQVEVLSDYASRLTQPWTTQQRDAQPWTFIQNIMALDDRPVFGFKLFNDHVRRVGALRPMLQGDDWKKVALIRDPLEVYASWLRARKTGQWIRLKSDRDDSRRRPGIRTTEGTLITRGTLYQPSIRLASGDRAQPMVRFTEDSFKGFKKFYLPFIERVLQNRDKPDWKIVDYDDLADAAPLQSVLEFVGSEASAADLSSAYEKQFSRPVSDAFENWQSLVEYLKRDKQIQALDWPGTPKWTELVLAAGNA